jgi:hypothetical protein
MKTIEEIRREREERHARLMEAYETAKRTGRTVPVTPEELARFEELCTVQPRRAPRPLAPATSVPEQYWIRC